MQEIGPEPERAIYALSVAAELLKSAQEKASESVFEEAITQSRDSMRIACSAILFKDGFVAPDLESTCSYLKKKYGDALPVDELREVETLARSGFLERVSGILGFGKGRQEINAKKALEAADRFLRASDLLFLE